VSENTVEKYIFNLPPFFKSTNCVGGKWPRALFQQLLKYPLANIWQKLPISLLKRQKIKQFVHKRQKNLQKPMAQFMHAVKNMRCNLPLNAG